MQALYAFFQSGNDRVDKSEKLLMKNTMQIYNLYIFQLSALVEIVEAARRLSDSGKQKYFPTEDEKNPNTKFLNNRVIRLIEDNTVYRRYFEALRINWADEQELFKKLFFQIRESEDYHQYMSSGKNSFEEDRRFIVNLYRDHLGECDELQQFYEEKDIFWVDDYDIVSYMIVKTLNGFNERTDIHTPLPELFLNPGDNEEDEIEDKTFMLDLFRKTIVHSDEYDIMIANKADNWELDRIALMDTLLLRMALCELTCFSSIPIKVTLNEYIEISKIYSSSKSKIFINGILDKLIVELKENGKLRKTGRGLME
jgi:transcription antitermination protein NusB